MKMKTAGIIGGISPESTIEYYHAIIAEYQAKADGRYPSLLINSIDLNRLLDFVTSNRLGALTDYLVGEIQRLFNAGANFAAIAANTPHIVFGEVAQRSPIPLLSIIEATCREAKNIGLKRLALLGTRYTMQGRFYPDVFSKEGLALVPPNEAEQAFIHKIYLGELIKGIFKPETRERLLKIIAEMKEREGVEAVILGGTELPLILTEDPPGIRLLDTTKIHVSRIVSELLS